MLHILFALVALVGVADARADDGWTKIPISGGSIVSTELKDGSLDYWERKNGERIGTLIIRELHKDGSIELIRIGMLPRDCANGYGKVLYYTPQGDFKFSVDYVQNSGTIGSDAGEFVCAVMQEHTRRVTQIRPKKDSY